MVWDHDHWSEPELIYLIRYSSEVGPGDNIGAHNTYPIILNGNQLILTLADPPSTPLRKLYVMQHTIEDTPASSPMPTPTPTALPTLEPTNTPTIATATPLPSFGAGSPPTDTPRPNRVLLMGVGPVLMVLFGVTLFRAAIRFKH
jgi:hypothetical protein